MWILSSNNFESFDFDNRKNDLKHLKSQIHFQVNREMYIENL